MEFCFYSYIYPIYFEKSRYIFMSLNMAFPTYPQEAAFNVGATCLCVFGNGQNQ